MGLQKGGATEFHDTLTYLGVMLFIALLVSLILATSS